MCAGGASPARSQAWRRIIEMPPLESPWRGARTRVNSDRSPHCGRPRSSQPTIASPTSTGRGRRSSRLALPWTTTSPARQSMLSSCSLATSPARRPRRDKIINTAKSRRPITRRRSQLLNIRATSQASIALGSEASRQLATEGTAPASSFGVRPSTYKKRSSARSLVVIDLAEATLHRRHSDSTNSLTSALLRSSRSSSPSDDRRHRKLRATSA